MPQFLKLCLEDLEALPGSPEYLQCVARPGSGEGLALDAAGAVTWEREDQAAFELWVSQDDQLVLRRRQGTPDVVVARAGRTLAAPFAKPVVLRDQDELSVAGRRYRVHFHGAVAAAHPPRALFRKAFAPLAAAVALTTAGCADAVAGQPPPKKPEIEVRDHPPDMAEPEERPKPIQTPDAGTADPKKPAPKAKP